MSKTYEELSGAEGRARFFRPRRHQAGELFAGEPPVLFFDDEPFALRDISATGAGAVFGPPDHEEGLAEINRRGVLRLVQHGGELFRARARQVRIDASYGRGFTAFALEQGHFDLDALVSENARALARRAAAPAALPVVPIAYKAFCADILSFVGGYLDRIEQLFGRIESRMSVAEKEEVARDLSASATREWKALLEAGNDLVIPSHRDPEARRALKAFTERVVTPTLVEGPGWARSYFKPLGYPGDFQIMEYIYEQRPVGATIRQMFLHLISLSAAYPVKSRMESLAELIVEHNAQNKKTGAPTRIMSIGSGTARELERIGAISAPDCQWEATLVDQETRALELATRRADLAGGPGRMSVKALNISFKEMLRPSSLSGLFAEQDIIYSAGLVDYLNPLLAQRFVSRMSEFLKPGGRLIIGNVNDARSGMIWQCEYVLDWTLFFRSEAEMRNMSDSISNGAVAIRPDSRDAIHFLVADRP